MTSNRLPLDPSFVTRGLPKFRDALWDRHTPDIAYWLELRSDEQGKTGLFGKRLDGNGTPERFSPVGFDIRSRVHEYGGGAVVLDAGSAYASSGTDNRLWRFSLRTNGADPNALTPPGPWRYADFTIDPTSPRLYSVIETATDGHSPRNAVGAVSLAGSAPRTLIEGMDFYASPRPSPDGKRLAWVQWRHPHLPWEATELVVGAVNVDGSIGDRRRIAGGGDESIVDPQWHPDGSLYFVADGGGRWNLSRATFQPHATVTRLTPFDGDFALPPWVFQRPLYGFDGHGNLFTAAVREGRTSLWRLIGAHWEPWLVDDRWSSFEPVRLQGSNALAVASGPYESPSVVVLGTAESTPRRLRQAVAAPTTLVDYTASVRNLPRRDGGTVTAFAYRPQGHAPVPGIVSVHGGPTAQANFGPDATVLFWLSQGFAWIDVNYGGSTGYGRDFRDRLRHRWGTVDVADCEDAAAALAADGTLDCQRIAIRGGSAGGYTALRAAARDNVFSVATSAYGVSDLALLFSDTHKFESHYGEWLLGDLTVEALKALSPIAHPEAIRVPVLFLQGLDDKIVPPAQSEAMFQSLQRRGIATEYVSFPGEGHGFRRAETIEKVLATELAFYRKAFHLA